MAWDVMSGVTKMAWDVMSGVTKTAWDVLSGVANLCGMFCPGCKNMAWDVLSRDVLSGSRYDTLMKNCFKDWSQSSFGVDWLQSFKQFFINASYHILVANLTLMALF